LLLRIVPEFLDEVGKVPEIVRRVVEEGVINAKQRIALNVKVPSLLAMNDMLAEEGRAARAASQRGCFVATAVYGTPYHPAVVALKSFRDEYLMVNWAGRQVVRGYWLVSPSLAEFLHDAPRVQRVVRLLLAPIVAIARRLTATSR
jgi:hypothetical protein